jgi:hypothetical protein
MYKKEELLPEGSDNLKASKYLTYKGTINCNYYPLSYFHLLLSLNYA